MPVPDWQERLARARRDRDEAMLALVRRRCPLDEVLAYAVHQLIASTASQEVLDNLDAGLNRVLTDNPRAPAALWNLLEATAERWAEEYAEDVACAAADVCREWEERRAAAQESVEAVTVTRTPLEAWRAYKAAHQREDPEEARAMGHAPKRPQEEAPEEGAES